MMTMEGSTEIVNFMTPRAGVLVQGRSQISYIVKMHYFLLKSSSLLLGIDINDDQGRVFQNCKFNYLWGRGSF